MQYFAQFFSFVNDVRIAKFCDICHEITPKFAKDMNGLLVNLDVLCRLSFEPVMKSQENTKIV